MVELEKYRFELEGIENIIEELRVSL